jgi:hypothetical protein
MTIVGGALPSADNGNANALQFAAGVTGRRASGNTVGFIGTYANASSVEISAGQTGSGISMHGQAASANANTVLLYTNNTERARIDSSGNLLVGTTSSSITAGEGFKVTSTGNTVSNVSSSTTNANITYTLYSTGASAYRFYVGMGGTIFATSTAISAISDQRLKENVRDLETGLDSIMALKPRRFDWKEGKGQDKKDVAGFIAQEFEAVFPECVGTTKAGGDGIEYKNINHETLIPTLVKAIQELKAEFDAYKAAHP